MPDNFDALVESEIRDAKRPEPLAPPGMVGTSPSRETPRPRLLPHKTPGVSSALSIAAVVVLALNTVGSILFLSQGVAAFVAVLLSGAGFATMLYVAAVVIDRIDAAAHWSRQSAETLYHNTASKRD